MNSRLEPSDAMPEILAAEAQAELDDTLQDTPQDTPQARSRLISKVLAPALRLWLRSQVEHIGALDLKIDAGDRQLLGGHIRQVSLAAQNAIFKGLHLTHVNLVGQNIRVNLGQVLRGKALRLLDPVPVSGTLYWQEADLSASLNSPLLKAGVMEFLKTFLKSSGEEDALNLQDLQIRLADNQVVLSANLLSVSGTESAIAIRSGFNMASPNRLQLVNPQWLPHANAKRGMMIHELNGYEFDLGEETQIEGLQISPGELSCRAALMVRA